MSGSSSRTVTTRFTSAPTTSPTGRSSANSARIWRHAPHGAPGVGPSREQLFHELYEAAELEHNLMCTYLYAAFSLKAGVAEGLSEPEAAAVARWLP